MWWLIVIRIVGSRIPRNPHVSWPTKPHQARKGNKLGSASNHVLLIFRRKASSILQCRLWSSQVRKGQSFMPRGQQVLSPMWFSGWSRAPSAQLRSIRCKAWTGTPWFALSAKVRSCLALRMHNYKCNQRATVGLGQPDLFASAA